MSSDARAVTRVPDAVYEALRTLAADGVVPIVAIAAQRMLADAATRSRSAAHETSPVGPSSTLRHAESHRDSALARYDSQHADSTDASQITDFPDGKTP